MTSGKTSGGIVGGFPAKGWDAATGFGTVQYMPLASVWWRNRVRVPLYVVRVGPFPSLSFRVYISILICKHLPLFFCCGEARKF